MSGHFRIFSEFQFYWGLESRRCGWVVAVVAVVAVVYDDLLEVFALLCSSSLNAVGWFMVEKESL